MSGVVLKVQAASDGEVMNREAIIFLGPMVVMRKELATDDGVVAVASTVVVLVANRGRILATVVIESSVKRSKTNRQMKSLMGRA